MRRALAVLFAAGLLGGCTDADWDHALSYTGLTTDKPAAETAAAEPVPEETAPSLAPPADSGWCMEVAKATQTEAANQGFDARTQQLRAQQAFQQCSLPSAR